MDTDKLRGTYNQIAHDYFVDHKNDSWDDDYIQLFSDSIFPSAKVLDLGCGPGVESKKLSEKGFDVHGFDLSDEFLRIAQEHVPSGHFREGSMLDVLPYDDDFFDGVFAKASLLHVPRETIDSVMSEIVRILKKDGILHIAVKKGDGEKEISEDGYGYEYTRRFSFWQPEELNALFAKHNLETMKAGSWEKPHVKTVWLKYLLRK